jgi:hypothetical membrane protein
MNDNNCKFSLTYTIYLSVLFLAMILIIIGIFTKHNVLLCFSIIFFYIMFFINVFTGIRDLLLRVVHLNDEE